MSNPRDKFVTDRMADSTDVSEVDDGVNNLEAAIRTVLGLPSNPTEQVPPFTITEGGQVNFRVGMKMQGGVLVTNIAQTFESVGNDDNLATVAAIRRYVDLYGGGGGGGGVSFVDGQQWGSLWVSGDDEPVLAVGYPAYWQIVGRVDSFEGGTELLTISSGPNPQPVYWYYTIAEHPALEADNTLRPVETALQVETIRFPVAGIWHISCFVLVPNNPDSGQPWAPTPGVPPEWFLIFKNISTGSTVYMDKAPCIHEMGITNAALEADDKVVQYICATDPPQTPEFTATAPSIVTHGLRISYDFYVENAGPQGDEYQIQLKQTTGGDCTILDNAIRMVLRYIPTNGG